MSSPELSIIVVSYNTCALTLQALRSAVEETSATSFELLVVDNASQDGSAEAIRAEFPEAQLRALPENIGFGRAVNLAARDAQGRYLLLLNPDTRVLNQAIDRLVSFADANPAAGIYGGTTLNTDGTPNLTSCWNEPSLWSTLSRALGLSALFSESPLFDPERVTPKQFARESFPVDIVTGCFLLIRSELWCELEGFYPGFYMYGEDFDLCLRARVCGAQPLVLPAACIVHQGHASETVAADRLVRLLRSKVQLFERHWTPGRALLGSRLLLLWALTRRLGYRVLLVLGSKPALQNARTWDQVWARRGEITARSVASDSRG